MLWPVAGTHRLTAGWTYNNGSAHGAVDLGVDVGTPAVAAEGGVVEQVLLWDGHTRTGMMSYGNMIKLRHDDYCGGALETRYAHLSRVCVNAGDVVAEGTVIGYSGNTGNSTGPHLHFEVIWKGVRRNPLAWLDGDFVCSNSGVKAHLGKFCSVEPDTPLCGETVRVKPGRWNVRNGPGTGYYVADRLEGGQDVAVDALRAADGWFRVDKGYLSPEAKDESSTHPAAADGEEQTERPALVQAEVTGLDDAGGAAVGALLAGLGVPVCALLSRGDAARVQALAESLGAVYREEAAGEA